MPRSALLTILEARGFVHQCTDRDALDEAEIALVFAPAQSGGR
jgi:hypothetical protein